MACACASERCGSVVPVFELVRHEFTALFFENLLLPFSSTLVRSDYATEWRASFARASEHVTFVSVGKSQASAVVSEAGSEWLQSRLNSCLVGVKINRTQWSQISNGDGRGAVGEFL